MTTNRPVEALTLAEPVLREILAHAADGAPSEVCGLLAGKAGYATRAYRILNIAASPESAYVMHPAEQVRALYAMEAEGFDLAGIYHSHPPGSHAEPSPTDLAQATWPGTPYVIVVPPAEGRPAEIRAFLIGAGGQQEIPVWQE